MPLLVGVPDNARRHSKYWAIFLTALERSLVRCLTDVHSSMTSWPNLAKNFLVLVASHLAPSMLVTYTSASTAKASSRFSAQAMLTFMSGANFLKSSPQAALSSDLGASTSRQPTFFLRRLWAKSTMCLPVLPVPASLKSRMRGLRSIHFTSSSWCFMSLMVISRLGISYRSCGLR